MPTPYLSPSKFAKAPRARAGDRGTDQKKNGPIARQVKRPLMCDNLPMTSPMARGVQGPLHHRTSTPTATSSNFTNGDVVIAGGHRTSPKPSAAFQIREAIRAHLDKERCCSPRR